MIFYILSEFRNQIRKARVVLPNAIEYLRSFKEDFSELSRKSWGDDWSTIQDADAREEVFKGIIEKDFYKCLDNEPIKIPDNKARLLKDYISKFDSYLNSAMLYEPYLSLEEYQELTEIRMSFAFCQIRHFNETVTCYNPKTLMIIINNMIENNKTVVSLLHSMSTSCGYDFQK
jgi:hypothetical protein